MTDENGNDTIPSPPPAVGGSEAASTNPNTGPSIAPQAPMVWTVGGTMSMLAEREIAQQRADQERRLREADQERANSASVLRGDQDRMGMNAAIGNAIAQDKGLTLQRNFGTNADMKVMIEIPIDDSHVQYCEADVVISTRKRSDGTDEPCRTLVLVCPHCAVKRGQAQSQIHIRDDNRAWYLVDEDKGPHIWMDPDTGETHTVLGRVEAPERMSCPNTISCGFKFRLTSTNTGHPAITRMVVEGRSSRSQRRRMSHTRGGA